LGHHLKILALADLHDRPEQLRGLTGEDAGRDADLAVVCGDLHDGHSPEINRSTVEALAGLGLPVLIVPGNTDPRPLAEQLWSLAGFLNLDRRAQVIQGCGFIGFGGMVPHNPKRVGDLHRYYHSDEEVYQVLASCHEEIEDCAWRIVVTHQPPRGPLGRVYNGEITGSLSLAWFVEDFQPDLLICGHIHEAQGVDRMGKTRMVNVGDLRRGHSAMVEVNEGLKVVLKQR
jgi:uncharacterized protein